LLRAAVAEVERLRAEAKAARELHIEYEAQTTRERDELRAEVERLRTAAEAQIEDWQHQCRLTEHARDEARAEVERLRTQMRSVQIVMIGVAGTLDRAAELGVPRAREMLAIVRDIASGAALAAQQSEQ